jgi:CubicO group peptidase (beta-lactamase class C family)
MATNALSALVEATASAFGIPGVGAGVWVEGREVLACHGVTSEENPLPVNVDTSFGVGSVSKTFTATAMMRLVADGRVELDAPVRRYLPELRLADEETAAQVTILNLLNHTSGMDWGLVFDTGEGDDALARYVEHLFELEVIALPGIRTSYSQGAYNLAGRIIETVTDQTFERAVASLVLEPLGLSHSFYLHEEVMTRRFAVGHNRGEDGQLSIARLRRRPRGDNPGGGLASSVSDLLCFARFHLGDGHAESGERVLPAGVLRRMQQPTAALRGSNMGHAVGICWFLRDVDGVRSIGHGGSTNGQFAELLLVPERNFAVVSMSNAGPDGIPCNQHIVRWALQNYLGLRDEDPEPLPYEQARALEVVGSYENDVSTLDITSTDRPCLSLEVRIRPESRAAYKEMPPDHDPFDLGLLPGNTDEYVLTSGAFKGQRGFFTRDQNGAIVGVDLAGRLYSRVEARPSRHHAE